MINLFFYQERDMKKEHFSLQNSVIDKISTAECEWLAKTLENQAPWFEKLVKHQINFWKSVRYLK